MIHVPLHDTNDKSCIQWIERLVYFQILPFVMIRHSKSTNQLDYPYAAKGMDWIRWTDYLAWIYFM
jgi:hypothetical protein